MGAALMSDFIFFSSIRDEKISNTEMRFLRLGGKVVWIGLALIVISGFILFATDPVRYINSSKFIAKMAVVVVIIVNGAIFHLMHIPHLHRHAGAHFPSSDEFVRKVPFLLTNGAVSIISWSSALILGVLRSLPYSVLEILGVYVVILLLGVTVAISLRKKFIPHLSKSAIIN